MKTIGFGIIALAFGVANTAIAQTPVSATVNMSGSCASCDLSNRVMPRLSLQGSNFSGSNFSRSNLSGGKLHRSNLSKASFYKAYLMRAEGININMRGVVLRDATLIEAKLTNSDISYADLRRVDLSKGDFSKSKFIRSDLTSADAVNTNFTDTDFSNAQLNHSDCTQANFTNTVFENTKFGDAILTGAIFANANLKGANLTNVVGLTQSQLDLSCGNAKTKLPAHLKINECLVTTDIIHSARIETQFTQQPSPPPVVMAEQRKYIALQFSAPRTTPKPKPLSAIDLALVEINATLRDLPLDSPMHKRLSKSRKILLQANTQD